MAMNAVLGNAKHPEYGVATVPFPIPQSEYEHVIEMLELLEIGHATGQDCKVCDVSGWPEVVNRLCGQCVNLDELDYLAKRLMSFDEYEVTQFQGTVAEHDLETISALINQTFCCQEATVITNFSDLTRVGKQHYLTIMGGATRNELREIDGKETALLLLNSGNGKITPFGVVYDNQMKMVQHYDGIHFPNYIYDETEMIAEAIAPDSAQKSTWLNLPMSEPQLNRLLIRGGSDVYHFSLDNQKLSSRVIEVIEDSDADIYELNRLCLAISSLDHSKREKLDAIINMAFPEQPHEITQLILNMELFQFFPDVYDHTSYGRNLIQESGNYTFDPELDSYYDYEKCGREQMGSENGQFVAQGYIVYSGTISLDELMTGDPVESLQKQELRMGGLE